MDEAHRLAPRDIPPEEEEAKAVRATLIDAVRTTRKYGLGWMFISQTLSGLLLLGPTSQQALRRTPRLRSVWRS